MIRKFFIMGMMGIVPCIAQDVVNDCLYNTIYNGQVPSCNPNTYKLVIYDEFEGDHLDLSLWKYADQGVMNDPDFDKAKQWLQPQNCEVSGGTFKIKAKQEAVTGTWVTDYSTMPFTTRTETFNYTSGWIESNFKYGYGKYEIRCKIPYGKGFWPAFWMFGEDATFYNELDVFEFMARPGICNATDIASTPLASAYHYDKSEVHGRCSENVSTLMDFSEEFHTFAVIWDFFYITYLIDDVIVLHRNHFMTPLNQVIGCEAFEPDVIMRRGERFPAGPMNVILSMGVQKGSAGGCSTDPDINTVFPGTYEIDYFKYYKKTYCTGNASYDSYTDVVNTNSQYNLYYITPLDYANIITGGNITLTNGLLMDPSTNPNKQLTTFLASQSITITPNVFIDKLSYTMLAIDDELCDPDRALAYNPGMVEAETEMVENIEELTGKDDKNVKRISLYPNPTSDYIIIRASDPSYFNAVIYNNMGQPVMHINNLSNNSQLSLLGLANGMYNLLIFKDHLIVHSEKIIKK